MAACDLRWEDLGLGSGAQFEVTLTGAMMSGFATLSGDENPLHMDTEFAQQAGHPRCVAFGMMTSSFYSRLVGMHLPGRLALLQGISVDFHSPAYPGDTLTVSGIVSFRNEAYRRLELKAKIVNQHGALISKAKIQVGVHG
jgi:3-hydroxybutyryl-CoA dehydratase